VVENAWLVPAFPLLGAIVAAVFGKALGGRAHWPVVLGIAASFVTSMTLAGAIGGPAVGHGGETAAHGDAGHAAAASDAGHTTVVYRWLGVGDEITGPDGATRHELEVPIELRVDGLTVMMLGMVTFVATLVAIFASGYMKGDPGYARFFAEVGLFVFCMTGLVLSNNYVLTYAFWEGVGVCSYLLIGFWYRKPSAAAAAQKAFLVNRVGDVGFALAIFWMWTVSRGHDLSYTGMLSGENLEHLRAAAPAALLGIPLLLLWAATAKSAQVPLYVWLPDAMEGPTPVSALIHAATMVTAGVYLIARSAPLVFAEPIVPAVICVIGALTAVMAAFFALTQNDLKRVLAYSTISQLGFMFMALGCGVGDVMTLAVTAAMFHLFTHAFFKALLFLGSGSVMHAMGHVIDMRRFGGLRRRMPITAATFAIGGLALAGIIPFAGFWSKDEILLALNSAAAVSAGGYAWVYRVIFWVALGTAFLTAFYTGRAFLMTFWGPERLPSPTDPEADPDEHHHDHASDPHFGHESPPSMTLPLIVLAVCTVVVGVAFGPITGWFGDLVGRTPTWATLTPPEHEHHGFNPAAPEVLLGTLAGVAGLVLSWVMYGRGGEAPARLARTLRPVYEASYRKLWVDELYDAVIVKPTRFLAAVCKFLDVYLVDGLVRLVAWIPRVVGRDLIGPLQNGLVQFYAGVTALGLVALLVLVFWPR
jgi:NADH-quinone oxidoreductase subunit L